MFLTWEKSGYCPPIPEEQGFPQCDVTETIMHYSLQILSQQVINCGKYWPILKILESFKKNIVCSLHDKKWIFPTHLWRAGLSPVWCDRNLCFPRVVSRPWVSRHSQLSPPGHGGLDSNGSHRDKLRYVKTYKYKYRYKYKQKYSLADTLDPHQMVPLRQEVLLDRVNL